MKIYFEIFFCFVKIGLFTIGGGYVMIPLIQEEIVTKKKWFSKEDFLDMLTLAQSSPGVLAINIAIFAGHKIKKFPGTIAAAFGIILPSFIIILLIAMFLSQYKEIPVIEKIFKALRPVVVALIVYPVYTISRSANITIKTIYIPVFSALAIWLLGISPVIIIITAILIGIIYGYYKRKKI